MKSLPFCERCSQWVEDKETIAPCVYLTNPDDFKKQLDLGNYSVFGTLKPAKGAKDYTEVVLLNCRSCRQMPMIGVRLVTTNRDKNGKESTSKTEVIENLVADPATHEVIRKASIATESAP